MILRFLAARHKKLGIQPPGCKAIGTHVMTNSDGTVCKHRHLDIAVISEIVRADWCSAKDSAIATENGSNQRSIPVSKRILNKGYYITGKLNSTIYRDDCLFDGPDPDMPVRGLRKYLSAASHLFDPKHSFAELCSLDVESVHGGNFGHGTIVAHWMLGGVLMLPWRPRVKPWTGSTRYHLDDEGLIAIHEEVWDISVAEAFICTVFPSLGEMIWGRVDADESAAVQMK